jgi:hypothetical protein
VFEVQPVVPEAELEVLTFSFIFELDPADLATDEGKDEARA